MLLHTDYLILRKTPFQESSLIVSGLSPAYGRLDFLLKGARSAGRKKFPAAGLFRELAVSFRDRTRSGALLYPVTRELKRTHDAIADRPDNYLLLCAYAQFLLRHIRPMTELPLTYRALALALDRLAAPDGNAFQAAAAELVFLRECGLVPDAPQDDPRRSKALEQFLAYALAPDAPAPGFTAAYRAKLTAWVHSLRNYADSQ